MRRVRACIPAVVLLACTVSPAHAQWREQVSNRIRDLGSGLAAGGYRLVDDSQRGSLNDGASTSVSLTLGSNREHVIVGACDDDCDDLDLRLYDGSGVEIDVDVAIDATPRVIVPANRGTSFRVEVLMVGCSTEPCFWGLAVFEQGSAAATRVAHRFTGELAAGDPTLPDGEYIDDYRFTVQAGQRIVVDLRSNEVDTYLILRSPSGEQSENDDFGATTGHSRVDVVAVESGEWTARATSYSGGETGHYELTVGLSDPRGPTGGSGPRLESGRLEGGDETLSTGEYVDRYRFQGRVGELVVIDLRSDDFDPYLLVQTPGGEVLYNDDYEGDATRSLLSLTLGVSGEFDISVTSYRPGETGSYDLRIQSGGGEAVTSGPVQQRGVLSSSDETRSGGEYVDRYQFVATPGQHVTIDLQSDDFDTYLILEDPRGGRSENDDTDRIGHSVLEFDATESGTHQVMVTSYGAGATGSYELQIDVGAAATPAAAGGRDVVTLSPGQTSTGSLAAGDSRPEEGKYRDVYVFDGQAGQTVSVEMTSSVFDTYLGVMTPSGEQIENDDYEGSTSRSVVELTLRETGRYRVYATSYGAGQTGAYQITLRGTGLAAPAPGAAPAGEGRVYGVFAGISDYPGTDSDLPYTADDAVRVRDALIRGGGMRPEDGFVLRDAQATTGGVADAVRQLGARMGPNDTFVFFYSGHGGRIPRAGQQASDPDGLDETLALYDGRITDDAFSQLMDQVRAGKIIVLLDACFSGGFSKDVISVPGRMGMFSSEEDVPSSVAAKFRAGGFLAVFVADAIADGLADADGDGAVNAIELSQYVHERYRADLKSLGPADYVREQALGYQHLVVDRGSIGPYEILFTQR